MFATKWASKARKEPMVSEVERPSADITARQAAREAEERGASVHVLDGSDLTNKRMTLDGIAAVLDFPEWTGRNLDALYDCLTDLSWLPEGEHVLIWTGANTLASYDPKTFQRLKAVLQEAGQNTMCGRTFTAVLATG